MLQGVVERVIANTQGGENVPREVGGLLLHVVVLVVDELLILDNALRVLPVEEHIVRPYLPVLLAELYCTPFT